MKDMEMDEGVAEEATRRVLEGDGMIPRDERPPY